MILSSGDLCATGQDIGKQEKPEGIAAGYELGPNLGREVDASSARGSDCQRKYFRCGAHGTGGFWQRSGGIRSLSARLGNYNQFLGKQQNFLQGRNPMDMMGQAMGQFINPSQNYVNQGLGVQAMGVAQQGQSAFNATVEQGYSTFQNALQAYNTNQMAKQRKSTTKGSLILTTVRRKAGCTTNQCAVDSTPLQAWEEAAWAVAWAA